MKKKNLLQRIILLNCQFISPAILCSIGIQSQDKTPPNIILIFADDLGYGDLGCYGGKIVKTPNLDRLAAEGIRFTDAHVTCSVSGPSRIGLLTGKYPQRLGVYWNEDLWESKGWKLPDQVLLLPGTMKMAGYKTAHIGKWNISPDSSPYVDESYDVMLWKGAYYPDSTGNYPGVNGPDFKIEPMGWGPENPSDEYLTDRLTRRAVDFIERHKDQPFFLYLAYNAVHTPLQSDAKYNEIFKDIDNEPNRIYAGMVASLDENIGRLLNSLDELKLEENTIVVFTSDNGPAFGNRNIRGWHEDWPDVILGSAGNLRGHKGQQYEGGHREPFIIRWPAKLKGGGEFHGLTSTMDLLPTFYSAAGKDIPKEWELDGVNLLPFLSKENNKNPHDKLFLMTRNQMAVRKGKWKLIAFKGGSTQLYNLEEDPLEKNDLSLKQPGVVKQMINYWEEWNKPLPVSIFNKEKLTKEELFTSAK